jgi:hypothetical protein
MAKRKFDHAKSIMCEEIVLVNPQGEMQAKFSTRITGSGPSLRLYDGQGVERCVLEVDGNVVRFVLDRATQRIALALAVVDDYPGIRFYDGEGTCVAELGLNADSEFSIRETP